MTFESLAALFLPEASPAELTVSLDGRWNAQIALPAGADRAVWGRGPMDSGLGPREALRFASARRRARLELARRPPGGLQATASHRLPPPALAPACGRERIRSALLSGMLVELAGRDAGPRVIDRVLCDAGISRRAFGAAALHAGADGSLVVRLADGPAGPRVLRVAMAAGTTPPDIAHAAEALELLDGRALAPRLLSRGWAAGAEWTLETSLPGSRPRRAWAGMIEAVAARLGELPLAPGPPLAHVADLALIGRALPTHADALAGLSEVISTGLTGLPGVMRHGDVWVGNILARGQAPTGLVDWGAWHPAGAPGADLLHLVANDRGLRTRRPLGDIWAEEPWHWGAFRRAALPYWTRLGLSSEPGRTARESIALAAWACAVSGTLRRVPGAAREPRWVARNVGVVLGRRTASSSLSS